MHGGPPLMHNPAELISAIASLAWPAVIIAIVWLFKTEVRALLSRFRRGKFFGTEVELASCRRRP